MNNIPTDFRFCKYTVDVFDIIFEKEIINIGGEYVTGINIEKDFDKDMFPIIQLSALVDEAMYYKILDNKTTVSFKLRMMKYYYDFDNKIRSRTLFLNEIFTAYIDDASPYIKEKANKNITNDMNKSANKEITLYLFKEAELNNSKKIRNDVLCDVSMTDVITYYLSSCNVRNVLMSPFKNTNIYDEVLIPPLNLLGIIDYLQNVYDGYYPEGAITFFDTNCMYFLDRGKNNHVYRNGEATQVIISIQDPISTISAFSGSKLDIPNKKVYINVPPDAFTVSSLGIVNDQINGNNAIIISPSSNKVTKVQPSVEQRGEGTYRLLIDRYDNKYSISKYEKDYKESDKILTLGINSIDITTLTPNKQFIVVFENSKINNELGGEYRLSKYVAFFTKEGESFSMKAHTEFKRNI